MSYGYGRRPGGDSAYGGDEYSDRRWDRARFERERARPRIPEYEYGPPAPRRDDVITIDRYREEDDYYRRRSRPDFLDRDHSNTAGRELAPYNDRWEPERRPSRPTYERRQSSWDAHDRRPIPRYGDRDAELDVDIRINSPSVPRPEQRRRYYPEQQDEEYRDVRIVRERERSVYRRSRSRSRERRRESSESETAVSEEKNEEEVVIKKKEKKVKRGKTRMPKRLVHKRAIVDLGYPYEEEDAFFIVLVAMNKEQIDQVIKISETYRIVYKDDDQPKQLEAPPEEDSHDDPEPEAEIIETVTTKVIENPTPSEYGEYASPNEEHKRSPSPSVAPSRAKSRRGRSRSAHHSSHEVYEERDEEQISSSLVELPDRSRRSERDIKDDIRRLEAEKRALKDERDTEVIRIEKDRNGRLSLVRPSQ